MKKHLLVIFTFFVAGSYFVQAESHFVFPKPWSYEDEAKKIAAKNAAKEAAKTNQPIHKTNWLLLTAGKKGEESKDGNGESGKNEYLKAELLRLKLDAAQKYYSYDEYKKRAPAPKTIMEHWTVRGYARGVER